MKVAVSIPDDVFQAAEELVARRQCSRSSLYAQALRRLIADEATSSGEKTADGQPISDVTARLNAIYATEPSEMDPVLARMQAQALLRNDW